MIRGVLLRSGSRFTKGRRRWSQFGEWWLVSILACAGFALFVAFVVAPVVFTFYFSFTNWDGLSPTFDYVGLSNFARAAADLRLRHSWTITIAMACFVLVAVNAIGLGLALLLNDRSKLSLFYRSLFFFPIVLSSIVVGILWRELLNSHGIVNQILVGIGLPELNLLGDPVLAPMSITGVIVWQSVGFTMVIYLAGLQMVRRDLIDAAVIDGASRASIFRHVEFPQIAPAFTICFVYVLIGVMKEYDHVVAMTDGGPFHSSETVAYKVLSDGFSGDEFGYASGQAVLLFVALAFASVMMTTWLRRREEFIG